MGTANAIQLHHLPSIIGYDHDLRPVTFILFDGYRFPELLR